MLKRSQIRVERVLIGKNLDLILQVTSKFLWSALAQIQLKLNSTQFDLGYGSL